MHRYKAGLSAKSIKEMQRRIIHYKENTLKQKVDLFTKKLSERGVDIAQVKIADFDAIFTGELIESIHSEYKGSTKDKSVFAVVTDSGHAAFVEFGTGQRGLDVPYPHQLPQGVTWDYASGNAIRQNSVTGRYYWFYPGDDGKWHYTEGMPSRPYMFETTIDLRQEIFDIAKEVFG